MIGKLAFLLVFAVVVAAQPAPNRAGLVIQFANGSVETHCVNFSEPQINGLELLERADVPLITQGSALGAAVCKIGSDGCDFPTEGCFCATDGMRAIYWALHIRQDAAWTYANRGAANIPVVDGDVHGWAWGTGASGVGIQPPLLDVDAICGPLQQASTATLAAQATITPALPDRSPMASAAPTATVAPVAGAAERPGIPATLWIGLIMIGGLAGLLMAARRRRR